MSPPFLDMFAYSLYGVMMLDCAREKRETKHKEMYGKLEAIAAPNGVARNYLEALVMRVGQ